MSENEHDPDLIHLGRDLRRLSPRPCPIDRDAVMFQAGQASVPRNWLWPTLTLLFAGLTVTFGAALLVQPSSQTSPAYRLPGPPMRSIQPPGMPMQQPSYPMIDQEQPEPGMPSIVGGPTMSRSGDARATADAEYFHQENNILRWGLDAVPLPPPTPAPRPAEKPGMLMRMF
jgi:hypothetical protein